MTDQTTHSDRNKSPETLEREVDEARKRFGQNLDALSDRLSPGQLLDQALGLAREHGGEFGRNLGTEAKRNPLPLLLTGVGITWMMSSAGDGSRPRFADDGTTRVVDDGGLREKIADKASRAGDGASRAASGIRDSAESARERALSAQESLEDVMYEQPLLAGSLGMALGAALAALVPRTDAENSLVGATSDRAVEHARDTAREKYHEARERVSDADADRRHESNS